MAYEAYIDAVDDRRIAGWVYDDARPDEPITLEVMAGDRVVAKLAANVFRKDLAAAGKGNGWHGFSYHLEGEPVAGQLLSVRIAGKRWHIQPTTAATGHPPALHHDPRRRWMHTLEFGYPEVQTGFTTAPASAEEAAIVARLLAAFERTIQDDPHASTRKADMWTEIEKVLHGDLLALLRARDLVGLAAYLREAHAKGITWGITQGPQMTELLRTGAPHRRNIATEYADNLVSLAEFLNVLDVESPHQRGQWAENIHADPDELAAKIAAKVGFAIETPPVIGSYFGLKTRGGIVTGRDLCSLYAASRIRDIAADLGIASPKVCEIGGGMGGVAYYGARMGFDFTIIDLPLVSMLQGYFLLRALPQLGVQLYGEPDNASAKVRLMPTYCFHSQDRRYDILFNQDSIPEMNAEYSLAYLKRARDNVTGAFYSINQEARAPQTDAAPQTTVPDVAQQAGGWRRSVRYRHWLRAGYVDEVYRKAG
jgi:hypothetical protein